jgi:hypothetical protein
VAKQTSEKLGMSSRLLRDISAPLLRLSPTGWCKVIEKLVLLDHTLFILSAEEAVVRRAAGELLIAPLPNPVSLTDHLKRQALVNVPRRDYGVIANLIEEIDQESGHFKGDLLELSIVLERPATDLEEQLRKINHFRPLGCGAPSLHQALRCQIPELPDGTSGEVARLLLTDYWDTFSGGGRAILSDISGLGQQAIENGIAAIREHITPYPAERFWGNNSEYLKRGFCYIEEVKNGRMISAPYESEYYAAHKPDDTNDIILVVMEALRERAKSYRGILSAIEKIDLDDPQDLLDIEAFAEETQQSLWRAWLLTEGEMIVSESGDRSYLRETITCKDDSIIRLFKIIDNELAKGKAESDSTLAKLVSRGDEKFNEKSIALLRKGLGVTNANLRGDRAVTLLLKCGFS